MTTNAYRISDGHNTAGALADLTPQPASPDMIQTETDFYGDGHAEVVGFESDDLVWSAISYDEFVSLLAQVGVSNTVASNDVTVRLRRYGSTDYANYNATANWLRGEKRSQIYGVTGFRITFTNLVAL